ncbi:MAG: aminotransferase class V-fold PLP-dependent enzyme [Phycisphaerales bacterium]|nr:aminotransferase class V-fold PLP-dependent enzyme [Phycisphaerales bacterium]
MDWNAFRDEFAVTRNYNFQNHAGVAPMCRRAADAARQYLDACTASAYVGNGFYKHAEHVRRLAAQLINAKPDEVTFVKNTTEGINLVSNGLVWKNGDNVVTTNVEFPSNVYPWENLAPRGVKVRMVMEETGRIPIERLVEAIDSRTRVVAVSSVQFASGYRTDLATLGEHCQEKGVFLCVDAIQSLGAMPIDVRGMHIDFLSADAHKWLCGPEGIGLFFVGKEIQGYLKPSCIGWMSVKNAWDFDHADFDLANSISRYDSGSYNLMGIYALGGALEMLLEIGIDQICNRVLFLTDRLVTGLREKGYRVFSPRERAESSGIVSFSSDVHDHQQIQRHLLAEHRLVLAVRKGRLRASPHFYNTEKEIDQLVELLPRH